MEKEGGFKWSDCPQGVHSTTQEAEYFDVRREQHVNKQTNTYKQTDSSTNYL